MDGFTLFFTIILVSIFCGSIWVLYAEIRRVRRIRAWPAATARVVSSQVTESEGYEGPSYNAQVEYEYEVNGSAQKGRAYLMAVGFNFKSVAEGICRQHAPGTDLPIVYNPEQVGESEVADPSDVRAGAILFCLGISIGLIAWIIHLVT